MNRTWKKLALAGVGTGLALTIAFGVVGTSFAQTATQDAAQAQQAGRDFAQRGGPDGMHRGGGRHGFAPAAVASALGISEDELRTELQAGKSIADLATEKGVALDTVINAIVAEETTRFAQAVTDGKLTQEQADQRLADLTERLPDMLSQVPPANGGFERGGKMGGPGSPAVIAEALGVTEDELRTAFQDGKSVADVATEKGVSLDTVIRAIVTAETERLAQAVTDGKITQEQADTRLANLTEKLPDMLSQIPSARPEGMGGHGRHGGFDPGVNPDDSQQTPDSDNAPNGSSNVVPTLQDQGSDL